MQTKVTNRASRKLRAVCKRWVLTALENISPKTADFLRRFNFDVKSLIEENLSSLDDLEVIKLAKKEKRLIITFDLDFGEIFYFLEKGKIGVIILRLRDQRVEVVNKVLERFISYYKTARKLNRINKSLIILDEYNIRFYTV